MQNWNVVVTVRGRQYNRALQLLRRYGEVRRTDFFNVLLMRVEDPKRLVAELSARAAEDPAVGACLSRVAPVSSTFQFQSRDEFEERARRAVEAFVPELSGKSFHVRLHRRGFKGRISSLDAEHVLDDVLLEGTAQTGNPGQLSFEDPDAVVDVETVGTQAGLSVWRRDEIQDHLLLHPG
jgi:tRNA(Ser,Leu) C12 N-acetylase TAN1